jgi:CDP-4-dehydro-6-deoxyglucose reductase
VRVSLSKSDRSFSVDPERSVLDAALDAGLNLPHSCKGGNCGACRARLLGGEVRYPNGPPLGLSALEVGEGFVLLCQARALGDLCIETIDVETPDTAVYKRLPCRVERVAALAHDVLALFLRLPAAESFDFLAGQYIDVMLPGGRRRSFSIASPPHAARPLELHVRRVAGGEFTDRLFGTDPSGALLSIEGPLGQFVYRHAPGVPMLMVGGGTGFAPLKSIIRHVVEGGLGRDMILYWGARGVHDLYADAELRDLERRTPGFRYRPVLSAGDESWSGRRGLVHEAVLGDFETLNRFDVYASGPPAMIDAVRRAFPARGADPSRLYFDSFDYAPDSVARQRTMAASKS